MLHTFKTSNSIKQAEQCITIGSGDYKIRRYNKSPQVLWRKLTQLQQKNGIRWRTTSTTKCQNNSC